MSLKLRRPPEPSEMLLVLLPQTSPRPVAPGAGWRCRALGVGAVPLSGGARCTFGRVQSSPRGWGQQGHSGLGHLTLLHAGSSLSVPRKAQNPKHWGTALPCPVPPTSWSSQGETARLCSLQGMGGSRRDGWGAAGGMYLPPRCAGCCPPSLAQQQPGCASSPCLQRTSALQSHGNEREAAEGRASLGNLKQH